MIKADTETPAAHATRAKGGAEITSQPFLEITDLGVSLPLDRTRDLQAVTSASMRISRGQRVGLVGESGSGKSVSGKAISGLLPESTRVRVTGSIRIEGREMVGAPAASWRAVRGHQISMVFQDPLSSLNPTMRIGAQVAEASVGSSASARSRAAVRHLRAAGLDNAEELLRSYPFELSGGMRQRVMIAIALASEPQLIIADEPTTALDATVQKTVLAGLQKGVEEADASLLLITHDLPVVAAMCDYVYVMRAGHTIEHGTTREVFTDPQHEYTRDLIRNVRRLGRRSWTRGDDAGHTSAEREARS